MNGIQYKPKAHHPVRLNGPFHITHELVSLTSFERMNTIKRVLKNLQVPFETIPAGYGHQNIFVPGRLEDGFLIFEAHFDKDKEDPSFQAATDNTGSVAVLLAVIETLKTDIGKLPVAFLFTALEEQGLRGALRFINVAVARNYNIKGVFCFDMIGRGQVVAATSGSTAGFCFRIPFYKSMLYNGREFKDAPRIIPFEHQFLENYLPEVSTLKAFVSYTNANAFLGHNIPAVHLEGDDLWHADQVWGKYTDTIERLDEQSLWECKQLIENMIRRL
ncbi:MAG: M20/M25/M40 family metallo-hydrolase [Deltaproteobacteria bacterium]|nr:M20/M25/M40 family metallo-hydrolase [Deltaproteobacteria bacterium]